jgi:hypothetical protein
MTAPIVLIINFYRNKVPSLVRCRLQNISNSRTFRLLDPTSVSRGQLKQKDILFSRETNHHAIICCTYKTGHYCAHTLPITFTFAYSPSVLLFPSPSRSMANTSVLHPTSPSAPSINDDDSGYNSAMESAAMVTSSSTTHGVIKMDDGKILEWADFFKKTIVTEADHQAYHNLGWLSGNLISFIPEVDVPTVDDSTILCFECQLAAGLGLPPSKFLSSVMSYLGCSLVHLNANAVSALSSFAMLCECWLGIPPDTSLFWYYYSLARYSKTIFGGIGLSLRRKCRDEYIKATFKNCWKVAQQKWIQVDMHVEPPWVNKLLFPPAIKDQRKEPPMTDRLAALVRRITELRQAGLEACHCAEEFYLRRICPLDRRKTLAFESPRLADPSRDPLPGNIFIFSFNAECHLYPNLTYSSFIL